MDIEKFSPDPVTQQRKRFEQEYKDLQLILATTLGEIKDVDFLIKAGADLEAVDDHGNTILVIATLFGHTDIVRLLIENGANLNAEKEGNSLLLIAGSFAHTEIMRLLIQKGANVNVVSKKNARTPLLHAALSGDTNTVDLLIQKGANLKAKDYNFHTALSVATCNDFLDMSNLLFSAMSEKQVKKELHNGLHPHVRKYFDKFKQAVISHRMTAFKTLGPLALDINENNLFSCLPIELMERIASYYCALGDEAWHAPSAGRDGLKIYDAIVKNKANSVIFSGPKPAGFSDKRKAESALEDNRESKKIKTKPLEQIDDYFEEEMLVEPNNKPTFF